MKTALLLSALVAAVAAKCPDVASLKEFDSSQYVGQWYEVMRYPLIGELGETCAQANYTLQEDGSIRLENRGRKADGRMDSIKGTATVIDPSKPAELRLVFDEGFRGSYDVIRTDYTQSALVYSCGTVLGIRLEYAWILARAPQLDQDVIDAYIQVLADAGSDTGKFSVTPQNCGSYF